MVPGLFRCGVVDVKQCRGHCRQVQAQEPDQGHERHQEEPGADPHEPVPVRPGELHFFFESHPAPRQGVFEKLHAQEEHGVHEAQGRVHDPSRDRDDVHDQKRGVDRDHEQEQFDRVDSHSFQVPEKDRGRERRVVRCAGCQAFLHRFRQKFIKGGRYDVPQKGVEQHHDREGDDRHQGRDDETHRLKVPGVARDHAFEPGRQDRERAVREAAQEGRVDEEGDDEIQQELLVSPQEFHRFADCPEAFRIRHPFHGACLFHGSSAFRSRLTCSLFWVVINGLIPVIFFHECQCLFVLALITRRHRCGMNVSVSCCFFHLSAKKVKLEHT